MYNLYREQWLVDRFAGTVASAFGHEPCVDEVQRASGQAVISVAREEAAQRCAHAVQVHCPRRPGDRLPPVPLLPRRIPAVPVRACARGHPARELRRRASRCRTVPRDAAVCRPLLHGCGLPPARDEEHHYVRAVVRHDVARQRDLLRCVLVAVLLAVETTRRFRTPSLPILYLGIAAALALAYAIPNASLLSLSAPPRLVAATALAFAPIYLANLAFAKRFSARTTPRAPSGSTSSGRWSAAASSTWPCSSASATSLSLPDSSTWRRSRWFHVAGRGPRSQETSAAGAPDRLEVALRLARERRSAAAPSRRGGTGARHPRPGRSRGGARRDGSAPSARRGTCG